MPGTDRFRVQALGFRLLMGMPGTERDQQATACGSTDLESPRFSGLDTLLRTRASESRKGAGFRARKRGLGFNLGLCGRGGREETGERERRERERPTRKSRVILV